jgi:hypothetical protein
MVVTAGARYAGCEYGLPLACASRTLPPRAECAAMTQRVGNTRLERFLWRPFAAD